MVVTGLMKHVLKRIVTILSQGWVSFLKSNPAGTYGASEEMHVLNERSIIRRREFH